MKKQFESRKLIRFLTGLNLLQILFILAVILVAAWRDDFSLSSELGAFFLLVGSVSVLGSGVTILVAMPMEGLGSKIRMMDDSLKNINALNNDLRAQRHDFLNHLQVIYSLIELEEYEETHDYIERVYRDIQGVSAVLKTAHPAINAILQAKVNMCESRKIAVSLNLTSSLAELKIPSWEMCRVLGNIIDNSIYALTKDTRDSGVPPKISISLKEDLKSYQFEITNNGPPIPSSLWNRIFEAGFTTKKKEGEGMGLFICRQIMERYGGTLKVLSNDSETVFMGTVPR